MISRLWKGQDPNHSKFEITDLTGQVVLVAPFKEAINKGEPDTETVLRRTTEG